MWRWVPNSLKAGESNEFTIKGHMKESAGNEYMNESIDGIAITVAATQDTVENDSLGNTYDKDAKYPIVAMDTLQELINNATELCLRSWKAILLEVLRFPG